MAIAIKRIYEPVSDQDGLRVLVDRLWPRGIRKDTAAIDLWLKDIAPTTALRRWFNHDPEKWDEFKARYFAELDNNRENLQPLLEAVREGNVSLIYASRDEVYNQAVALKEYLENLMS
ncbi:MAG TPA: DUF488 domain-containing protein [Spirillospora sp.]|nr:DUF488 domain-containing protein [Spirillospora sp.]